MNKKHKFVLCLTVILAQLSVLGQCVFGGRRISVGADTPEFSVVDIAGESFKYEHGGGKVLMVVFLSAGQERSEREVELLDRLIPQFAEHADSLDVLLVVSTLKPGKDAGDADHSKIAKDESPFSEYAGHGYRVALDGKYELWGKFGMIVTPTVVISGKDDKVLWVEPGFGYDFAPVIEARLKQALGLAQDIDPADASKVRTVVNATVDARVKRHLKMAKLLRDRGREKSAIREIEKARAIDPNSVEVALELGEIYCKKGDGAAAVKAIGKVRGVNRIERSKVKLVLGWAKRLAGDLDGAEKELLEAVKENPRLGRAYFELGQVYAGQKEFEKAADAYYRSLSLVYNCT